MKRIFLTALALGVTAVLFLAWSMFGDHSSFYTGLKQHEKVPSSGSDITIYQNQNISEIFAADFRISEPNFLSFAREKHWDVQPISGSVFVSQAATLHEGQPNDKKLITDGWLYSKRAPTGAGITIAYDRPSGRAYIESSSR
jgi:hypothetical protein